MSTYNILSTVITNRDAVPKVLSDAYLVNGDVRECTGYVQTHGSADGAGSTYRLCTVPSNARMSGVVFQADALGTSAALSVGVWYPTFIPVGSGLSAANAGLVINTSLFVATLAVASATAATELLTRANVAINVQEQQLWQMAGLTSDPGIDLDIVAYVTTAVAAQGYVGLKCRFTF